MKMVHVVRRVYLPLAVLAAIAFLTVGCGGGHLNVNDIGPNSFGGAYAISGDTPKPHATPVGDSNVGTINVVLSRIDLADDGTAKGTVSSSTLGKFNLSGTIDKSGKIVLIEIGDRNDIMAHYEGKLTILPDGRRQISGVLTFTNGQSTDLALAAGPAPTAVPIPPPTNDNFVNAKLIQGTNGHTSGTTAGDTGESGEPNHACRSRSGNGASDPLNSVWYKWVAPKAGQFQFFSTDTGNGVTTGATSRDTTGATYSATTTPARVNALSFISASDDSSPGQRDFNVFIPNAIAGQTYYIAVASFGGFSGTFTLNWKPGNNATVPQRSSCTGANDSPT